MGEEEREHRETREMREKWVIDFDLRANRTRFLHAGQPMPSLHDPWHLIVSLARNSWPILITMIDRLHSEGFCVTHRNINTPLCRVPNLRCNFFSLSLA